MRGSLTVLSLFLCLLFTATTSAYDVCENNGPCSPAASCLPSANGKQPICKCPMGLVGPTCHLANRCITERPCNQGECLVDKQTGDISCNCTGTGFTGELCDKEIDECNGPNGSPCLNNASCVNVSGTFYCKCPKGFVGDRCQTYLPPSLDPCNNFQCLNGGKCNIVNKTNPNSQVVIRDTRPFHAGSRLTRRSYLLVAECLCPDEYKGDHCQLVAEDIVKYKEEPLSWETCKARGCSQLAHNGVCNTRCNFAACNWDGGDCPEIGIPMWLIILLTVLGVLLVLMIILTALFRLQARTRNKRRVTAPTWTPDLEQGHEHSSEKASEADPPSPPQQHRSIYSPGFTSDAYPGPVKRPRLASPLNKVTATNEHRPPPIFTELHHQAAMCAIECPFNSENVNAVGPHGWTPLHCLLLGKTYTHRESIRSVPSDPGSEARKKKRRKKTSAVLKQMELLIDAGANLNWQDDDERSALHVACAHREWHSIVSRLLAAGADPTRIDSSDRSPLHVAVLNHSHKIVDLLLKDARVVSEIDAIDKSGRSALMIACAEELFEDTIALKLLEARAGVMPEASTVSLYAHGRTALHCAAQAGNTRKVRLLIDRSAVVDAKDDQDETPLHLAARENRLEVVRMLVMAGATRSPLNLMNQTPCELAEAAGYISIGSYLRTTPVVNLSRQSSSKLSKSNSLNRKVSTPLLTEKPFYNFSKLANLMSSEEELDAPDTRRSPRCKEGGETSGDGGRGDGVCRRHSVPQSRQQRNDPDAKSLIIEI